MVLQANFEKSHFCTIADWFIVLNAFRENNANAIKGKTVLIFANLAITSRYFSVTLNLN